MKQDNGLGFDWNSTHLVISGDLYNKGYTEGLRTPASCFSGVTHEFGLTAERCIIVPGNHDLRGRREVYDWKPREPIDIKRLAGMDTSKATATWRAMMRVSQTLPSLFGRFYHKFVQKALSAKLMQPKASRSHSEKPASNSPGAELVLAD